MLTDDTGAVIKRYDYDPYGVELGAEDSTDENPFRYSGQYTDRETGYVYLRARYYDPALGRFLSMDLMMDGANWYIYCAGNPIRFVDPSGFTSEEYAQYLSSYKPKMRGSFNSSMDYMEYMRQNTAQKITETPVRVRPRGSYANSAEYAQFLKDSSPEAPAISKVSPTAVSEMGVKFVSQYESFYSKPKDDKYGNITVGYGHVVQPGESFGTLNEQQALDLLHKDMSYWEQRVVGYSEKVDAVWNQNQFDALVSFAFNTGNNFTGLIDTLQSGADPYDAFSAYNKAYNAHSGKKEFSLGLWRRRMDEADIFVKGDYERVFRKDPRR